MSVSNIIPRTNEKLVLYCTSLATFLISLVPIVLGSFLDAFMVFLGYVGLIFAPLLGIMLIDFYFINDGNYDWSQADLVGGKYWFSNGINWRTVACWFAGVVVYFVMLKVDFVMNTMGAIYATLIVTSVIYWIAAKSSKKSAA
jgi:cytosine/uracil/thiamine/allantoin permease